MEKKDTDRFYFYESEKQTNPAEAICNFDDYLPLPEEIYGSCRMLNGGIRWVVFTARALVISLFTTLFKDIAESPIVRFQTVILSIF